MPTFHFFKNGNKVDEMSGADKSKLEALVQKHNVEVTLPEDERVKLPEAASGTALRHRKPQIVKVNTEAEWEALQQQAKDSGKTVRERMIHVASACSAPCQG